MLREEILFNIKNQAHKVLGRCLNEQCQLSQCIIASEQFNNNIDMVLLQRFFGKERCFMYIFRAWITRNGIRIYAKDYGKKAFRFWVDK